MHRNPGFVGDAGGSPAHPPKNATTAKGHGCCLGWRAPWRVGWGAPRASKKHGILGKLGNNSI
eukprot:13298855-Alexandrium_andersonii.AAC.1